MSMSICHLDIWDVVKGKNMWLFLGNVEVSFKFMCVHYHEHIVIDGFLMGQWVGYKHNEEGLLLIIETN